MELSWVPACKARFVARVTVVNGNASQGFVRDVIGYGAISGRVGAGMAGGALIRHNRLRVVPLAGRPACHVVAGTARRRGWNMGTALTGSRATIVATGTVGRCSKGAVIHFGTCPVGRCLVAGLAVSRDGSMDSCGRFGGQAVGTAQMAAGTLI